MSGLRRVESTEVPSGQRLLSQELRGTGNRSVQTGWCELSPPRSCVRACSPLFPSCTRLVQQVEAWDVEYRPLLCLQRIQEVRGTGGGRWGGSGRGMLVEEELATFSMSLPLPPPPPAAGVGPGPGGQAHPRVRQQGAGEDLPGPLPRHDWPGSYHDHLDAVCLRRAPQVRGWGGRGLNPTA